MLAAVPALIDQLQIAVSKQAKVGGGNGKAGKGSAHERSPVNWGAAAVRDALLVEVALWGDDIDAIRKHPQAADILSGVGRAVKDAYRAIDRMQDRKYLGKCMNTVDGVTCHAELWARPTAGELRCRDCGYEHNVANRRLDMLDMARDLIVTPREAARYIGEVGGIGIGEQRIRNYVDRKRITARPSSDGAMKIRLGDLLVVILDDGERRTA
jgi:hypothetical protein